MQARTQPDLFESKAGVTRTKDVLMYALGEFQARGHVLSDRELALDRLHGACTRAFVKFGIDIFSDEKIAEVLGEMGARVNEVPSFAAKRPYRIMVPECLARESAAFFLKVEASDKR